MQDYFTYVGTSLCGIPSITLLGTAADYELLRDRVVQLGKIGPKGWTRALEYVCVQLVAAARGNPDLAFFRSIYKVDQTSGGPYMNGWLNVLFPYQWNATPWMYCLPLVPALLTIAFTRSRIGTSWNFCPSCT